MKQDEIKKQVLEKLNKADQGLTFGCDALMQMLGSGWYNELNSAVSESIAFINSLDEIPKEKTFTIKEVRWIVQQALENTSLINVYQSEPQIKINGKEFDLWADEEIGKPEIVRNFPIDIDPNQPLPNFDDDYMVTKMVHNQEVKTPALFKNPSKPTKGLCVDVGCKGNPGKASYRGVDIETGKEIFFIEIPGDSTNNIGEFLAAVAGLEFIKKSVYPYATDDSYKVYSDSITAIAWVRQKKCKTKHVVDNLDQLKMIALAETFLKNNGGKAHFWDNKLWGEIIADLSGRKGVKR